MPPAVTPPRPPIDFAISAVLRMSTATVAALSGLGRLCDRLVVVVLRWKIAFLRRWTD